jgi:hypothetical protein
MIPWTKHKRWDWILSGLNIHCWEGDKNAFLQAGTRTSNPVEASGAQSNRLGISKSLMAAIIE